MSEQNKEIVRRYYQEFNSGNLDALDEIFTAELAAKLKRGGTAYGAAFPDLHVSVEELIAEGDSVFVRSIMSGTQDGEIKGIPATGRHVTFDCGEVFRFEGGRIVSHWCQVDVAGMVRQLTEEQPAVAATA
jgi:predicted ester cyclase